MTPYILSLLLPFVILTPFAVAVFVCESASACADKFIQWLDDVITAHYVNKLRRQRRKRRERI